MYREAGRACPDAIAFGIEDCGFVEVASADKAVGESLAMGAGHIVLL